MSDTSFSDSNFNFDPTGFLQTSDQPAPSDYTAQTPQQQVQSDIAAEPTPVSGGGDYAAQSGQSAIQNVTSDTQPSGGGFFNNIGNWLSHPTNLFKLGVAGLGAGAGLYNYGQAQSQGAKAQSALSAIPQNLQALANADQTQLNNISQQYQAMVNNAQSQLSGLAGPQMAEYQNLVNLTNQGQLTPANKQIMENARAQLAQQSANRGGVGAEQAQGQLDRLNQTLLAGQMTQALQLYQSALPAATASVQTGLQGAQTTNNYQIAGMQQAMQAAGVQDSYLAQAIQMGLQNSREASAALTSLFTGLAGVLAGTPSK